MPVCDLASQWQTIPYLVHPTEILKCFKFPPLISVPCASAYDFLDKVTEGVVHSCDSIIFWCNTASQVLIILPHVHPMNTECELRLLEVVSQ